MPPLSDTFLQELKLKTDISDLVSSYVTLKKRGNTYVGLCPFHNEKTPSFTVYADTQSFYCFGCGAGGDAIGFMRKIENLDYIDAVKSLAQRAGMQMPEEGYDDTLAKQRRTVLEINRATARFYHEYLLSEEGKVGLNYFLNRGLSRKTITHFGLGFAPDSWDSLCKHLASKGYRYSDMLTAGVVRKGKHGYYDYFRNKVMTPIIDVRGNVIAFGGRVLDNSKPKYINTNETIVYKKTNELFGLNFAKDSGKDNLILCEGYMDVIAMHQAGFNNAVGGCGTALTPEQVRLINRYTNEVILVYDNDEAGKKALRKAITLFNQTDIKIKIPKIVGGKDPDEIIKQYGKERFAAMLDSSSNEIEFELLELRSRFDISTTQGKIDFANESVKVLAGATPIEQDLYVSRLAEELGIQRRVFETQLQNYSKNKLRRDSKKQFNKIVDESIRFANKESFDNSISTLKLKAQERILGLLLLYPDCYKLCQDFDSQEISEGFYRKAYEIIVSRIKDNLSLDLIMFHEDLSEDEISRLSKVMAVCQNSVDSKREFVDCLNVIRKENIKTESKGTADLDDDAFRSLFNKNT